MNTDIHALITRFLQAHVVTQAVSSEAPHTDYQKAGIIPYLKEEGEYFFYVMKPIAGRPGLPPPKWQLCKGTRMYLSPASGKWRDFSMNDKVEDREAETLVTTALREGHEELGLLPESVQTLCDMGPYNFVSAKSGHQKAMWMFAAEVEDRNIFLPASLVAETTADRRWISVNEFKVVGRDDHLYILETIQNILIKQLSA